MNSRISAWTNGAGTGGSQESELSRALEAYLVAVEAGQEIGYGSRTDVFG